MAANEEAKQIRKIALFVKTPWKEFGIIASSKRGGGFKMYYDVIAVCLVAIVAIIAIVKITEKK